VLIVASRALADLSGSARFVPIFVICSKSIAAFVKEYCIGYFSRFPFFLCQEKVEIVDSRYTLFYHIVSSAAEGRVSFFAARVEACVGTGGALCLSCGGVDTSHRTRTSTRPPHPPFVPTNDEHLLHAKKEPYPLLRACVASA